MCGTEGVYFATWHLAAGGGIMVTASHNPADYNGMKLVREQAKPVSGDSGLDEIRRRAEAMPRRACSRPDPQGRRRPRRPARGLCRAPAGLRRHRTPASADARRQRRERECRSRDRRHRAAPAVPDDQGPARTGRTIPERRAQPVAAREPGSHHGSGAVVRRRLRHRLGRGLRPLLLFDERGGFIEGYYIVGLLAAAVLAKAPGSRIVHDPRLAWNTREIVARRAAAFPSRARRATPS